MLLGAAALASVGCRTWSTREERAADAYNRANAYHQAGKSDDAIAAYVEALEHVPDFKAASYNLAVLKVGEGKSEEGLEILNSLLREDPQNLKILRAMAWAAWESGDSKKALTYYDRVLEVSPGDLQALEGKASVLEATEDFSTSAELRRFIFFLDDTMANALDLAGTLENSGDLAKSLDVYKIVLTDDPDNKEALAGAARVSNALGDSDSALSFYQRAAESGGDGVDKYRFEAAYILLVHNEDYSRGLAAFRSALEMGFDDDEALEELIASSPPVIRAALREAVALEGREKQSD